MYYKIEVGTTHHFISLNKSIHKKSALQNKEVQKSGTIKEKEKYKSI